MTRPRSAPEYAPKHETERLCRYCGEQFEPRLVAKRSGSTVVYLRSGRLTCSEFCRREMTGDTFRARREEHVA